MVVVWVLDVSQTAVFTVIATAFIAAVACDVAAERWGLGVMKPAGACRLDLAGFRVVFKEFEVGLGLKTWSSSLKSLVMLLLVDLPLEQRGVGKGFDVGSHADMSACEYAESEFHGLFINQNL